MKIFLTCKRFSLECNAVSLSIWNMLWPAVKRQLFEVSEAQESSHQVPAPVLAVQKFSLRPQKKNKLTESKGKITEINLRPLHVGLKAKAQSVRRQVLIRSLKQSLDRPVEENKTNTVNLMHPGNRKQFEFNSVIKIRIEKVTSTLKDKKEAQGLASIVKVIDKRNKLIRLADRSDGGWAKISQMKLLVIPVTRIKYEKPRRLLTKNSKRRSESPYFPAKTKLMVITAFLLLLMVNSHFVQECNLFF